MSAVPTGYYRINRERMIEARREAMLTHDELAECSRVSVWTLSRIERGDRYKYGQQLGVVKALASALHVEPQWLVGGTPGKHLGNVREIPGKDPAKTTAKTRQTNGKRPENNGETPGTLAPLKTKALDLAVDLSTHTLTSKNSVSSARKRRAPYSPQVKALAAWWKDRLTEQGVTLLPQDWTLKACAVVGKALRSDLEAEDVRDALEWAWEQPWWSDKLHEPRHFAGMVAQWQQREVKALAERNGKPSGLRLDRIAAAAREAIRDGR